MARIVEINICNWNPIFIRFNALVVGILVFGSCQEIRNVDQSTFRNNTFFERQGTLTMRHGNEVLVENNFFFRKANTGGVQSCVGRDEGRSALPVSTKMTDVVFNQSGCQSC